MSEVKSKEEKFKLYNDQLVSIKKRLAEIKEQVPALEREFRLSEDQANVILGWLGCYSEFCKPETMDVIEGVSE
jgi:hypothetical protein